MRQHKFKLFRHSIKACSTAFSFNNVFDDRMTNDKIVEFTGESDNHGTELYETDVIETYCYNKTHRAVIEHTNRGFKAGDNELNTIFFKGAGTGFKKIGNILENPGLARQLTARPNSKEMIAIIQPIILADFEKFGYESTDRCHVCGDDENTRAEPRFGYSACHLHYKVPPND